LQRLQSYLAINELCITVTQHFRLEIFTKPIIPKKTMELTNNIHTLDLSWQDALLKNVRKWMRKETNWRV